MHSENNCSKLEITGLVIYILINYDSRNKIISYLENGSIAKIYNNRNMLTQIWDYEPAFKLKSLHYIKRAFEWLY